MPRARGMVSMKRQMASIAALALVLGLGAGTAPAQDTKSSEPLGDIARQLKAQRTTPKEKPRLFTNDDLTARSPSSEHPVASSASASTTSEQGKAEEKPVKEASGKEAEKERAGATSTKAEEETHGEQYFRNRMSKLQGQLDIHQRELSVLQQKLGQGQMLYYPNPNQGLLQQSGPTAMSDVYKLQDQIAKKKAEVAADQEAIENFREQLRREGGDAGWLR